MEFYGEIQSSSDVLSLQTSNLGSSWDCFPLIKNLILMLPNLPYLRQRDNFLFFDCYCSHLAVAPVVPELTGDADTSNFEDISGPEGSNETFELTKVGLSWAILFLRLLLMVIEKQI